LEPRIGDELQRRPGAGNTIANLVGATVSRSTGPTLQFIADPGLKTNDWVMLSGGGRGWSGTFYVNGIVTKTTPKNGPTTWNVPVTAVLPTVDPRRGTTQLPSVARAGSAPAATDVKKVLLQGWFTDLQGAIFNDLDGNGKRDECPTAKVNCNPQYVENADGFFTEPGIPDFTVTVRTRGNSLVDQGAAVAKTNDEGSYDLGQAYPLGQFLIFEAYNPRFKNTGFTYQADNDHVEHTVLTSQVDYNFLPIIGLSGRIDVGVQAYGTGTDYWSGDGATPASKNENGGIVGTVSYDVTRNEFNPAYSLAEDYQPGVAGIPVQLWKPVIGTDGKPVLNGDGSLAQQGMSAAGVCTRLETLRGTNAVLDPTQTCKPFDYYVSEHWTRPTGCQALDLAGHPLTGEFVNPKVNVADDSHTSDKNGDCVESPMNGFQIGGDGSVDGNYALNSLIRATSLQQAPAGGQALADFYSAAQGNGDYSDPLTNADYVVEAVNPVDTVVGGNTTDPTTGGYHDASKLAPKRLYQFTDEVEVNVLTGDTYVPQEGFSCDAKCEQSPGYALQNTKTRQRNDVNSLGAGTVAQCVGANHLVDSSANPDFAAGGGSPFDGETTPICDAKLVKVVGGRSVNPNFYMYTQVPTPSKFFGLMNDDLNLNTDRRSVLFGEVAPVSNGPVGIYDENGNWKYTAHTDHNGFYEVILPSMDTYNCPLPAGPCPNVYRLVGNDPGTLAHRNLDYNPGFRTIATEFQAWTGVIHPVDQAPTHQGITIDTPGSQFSAFSLCQLAPNNPSLFRIDQPFFNPDKGAGHTYTVQGQGFGAAPKVMVAYLNNNGTNGTSYTVTPTSSSDTALSFQLPDAAKAVPGSWQVTVKNTDATSGMSTVNGITLHVLHSDTPDKVNGKNVVSNELRPQDLFFVTPDSATDLGIPTTNKDGSGNHLYTPMNDAWDPFTDTAAGFAGTSKYGDGVSGGRAVQRAIEAAHQAAYENVSDPKSPELGHAKLVVVYPNTAENYASHNAFASYFENLIVHGNVMLQGVGPGGATTSSNIVEGTSIDASTFWSATQATPAGGNPQTSDGNYQDDWRAFANRLPIDSNNPDIPEGQSVLALAESGSQHANSTHSFKAGVDGFQLTGGDQMGTPTNINTAPGVVGGDTVTAAPTPGPAQGGAITLDQHITWFAISNNLIQGNGGTFGTIRIGTPDLPIANNHNENLKVANNRVIANSGTNLAGGLGIFNGADNYTVTGNDFCGNFSAEYGGAIGHYGQSGGGTINKNRIYYNQSYDEGGGIMIAGELPANNNVASVGAGRSSGGVGVGVTIDSNLLLANLANDDGGGVRFLSAGNFPFLVQNNIIANNVSTHEGGGISLDDAPNVSVVNNTVVKNITTGTAVSNGAIGDIKPANPAGLSTAMNTSNFQKTLGKSALVWSKPTLLNNIFSDNRAGWATLPTDPNATALHGIGDPGDPVGIQRWDIGAVGVPGAVFDGASNFTNSRDTLGLTNAVASSTAYVATDNLTAGADGTVGMG
ncbi:MAG: hypothetical protein WCI22_09915, partial [Actinomycetota bacterium]